MTNGELLGCALIGLLLPVLGQGMVTVGENGGAPSGITALLIAAVPLWVICYRALSGERPTGRTLAGAVVGFGGVAVLIAANGLGVDFPAWTLGVIVLAGLSWAFGSWLQPRLRCSTVEAVLGSRLCRHHAHSKIRAMPDTER